VRWGDKRRMRWTRKRLNRMRLTEWRRELIPEVRWCIMWKSAVICNEDTRNQKLKQTKPVPIIGAVNLKIQIELCGLQFARTILQRIWRISHFCNFKQIPAVFEIFTHLPRKPLVFSPPHRCLTPPSVGTPCDIKVIYIPLNSTCNGLQFSHWK